MMISIWTRRLYEIYCWACSKAWVSYRMHERLGLLCLWRCFPMADTPLAPDTLVFRDRSDGSADYDSTNMTGEVGVQDIVALIEEKRHEH